MMEKWAALFAIITIFFWQTVILASADPISNGRAAFAACSACHSTTGVEDSGPHLNGLLGRKAGSVSHFDYSSDRLHCVWMALPQAKPCGQTSSRAGSPATGSRNFQVFVD
jgi:cytochrome c2